MLFARKPLDLPSAETALKGREAATATARTHFVNNRPLKGPYPQGVALAQFAMGQFWGAERRFWPLPGVWVTAVGYAGGLTPNPTYEEVTSGRTGHAETVLVVYDPKAIAYEALLKVFWEGHDPTQGMRQGKDAGAEFRSAIFTYDEAQKAAAERSRQAYGEALAAAGCGPITTQIAPAGPFYFAEARHQQYLAKNPTGYGGAVGVGVNYRLAAESPG
jgi:peptide-methionine (S)-S-oxide reductase